MMRTWTWVAVVGLLVGCGGTVESPVAGDGGGKDAAGDVVSDTGSDAGSCVPAPVPGTACKVGDVSCDKVDGCCAPVYSCNPQTSKWEALLTGCMCAGFKCGDKTCMGTELCLRRAGGVPMPDGGVAIGYECAAYPTACQRQWTCDCVTKNIGPSCLQNPPGVCDDSTGHPTLSCLGQ